jgi:hypothetical protein
VKRPEVQIADLQIDCASCKSNAVVPDVPVAGMTVGQQYDYVEPRVVQLGWSVRVGAGGGRELLCPACTRGRAAKANGPLPPFEPAAACPKCGAGEPLTRYWSGRELDSPLGVPREHLGRTCRTCGYVWVNACKDDARGQAAGAD